MLLLPETIYARRKQLWNDFESGKLTADALYRTTLELDPDDFICLTGMGKVNRDAGDFAEAEQYLWRAIRANPCAAEPYIDLARILQSNPESHALSMGLAELSILKRSREDNDDFLKGIDETAGLKSEDLAAFRKLPPEVRGKLITSSMRENRADEPAAVTEQLRPLRLIEQLQTEDLDAETVDEIVAEGPVIVPFLVGVLRAWAQDYLDEESGDSDLENALALLGEIGSPEEIPHLLEFIDLENEIAAGASSWALQRIVDRRPVESAKFIGSILASLDLAARLEIAKLVLYFPAFDPDSVLLEALSDNLTGWTQENRDVLFRMLLVTMVLAGGRAGVSLGRAALRRQGSLLSRAALRECEEILAACEEGAIPPLPPRLPALTVYDICAGEATWGEGLENEDLDEDFLPPPEPVRRRKTPGRNDPCWCSSGKKYKKCHLDSDERQNRQVLNEARALPGDDNEFSSLRKNIGEFLGQVLPRREMQQSVEEFAGVEEGAPDEMALIDWMIHDRVSPVLGKTVLEEYLGRRPKLTEREREIVETWSRSYVGLYEVQQMKAGTGIEIKDLIFENTFFVHDVNISTRLSKWDGLLARVVPGERGLELAGAALTVPRMHLQRLREWMDADRVESGLAWREYLKGNWPRIRTNSLAIAARWRDTLQLANTDGDELLFSKAIYSVSDEAALISTFQLAPELRDDSSEDELGARFVWLNNEKTVLGSIEIGQGELSLEANSKARLDRGKQLISDLSGTSIRHLRDVFTSTKDLKHAAKERPTRGQSGSRGKMPPEVSDEILGQVLERHYREWLDIEVPALEGKTPREAAKTAKGREQLEEVLKFIENSEDWKRQRGEPFYDMSQLRSALGM